jgi:long-chain acyl-CoA synthetase
MPIPTLEEVDRILLAPGSRFEIEKVEIRGLETRVWRNAPPTLRAIWEHARSYGERTYLVYEGERWSYERSHRAVARLARHLVVRHQVRKGDRVAIAMRNYPEWALSFFAAASVGAVVVPLNAWLTGRDLEYALADSETGVLIADGERAELLAPRLSKLSLSALIVARGGERPLEGWERLEDLLGDSDTGDELPEVPIGPDDDATIFYTSGTTGRPKGALGTHRNFCTNLLSVAFCAARGILRRGGALPRPEVPAAPTAALVSVPFFHVTGANSVLVANTHAGNKLVMMYRWDPERALELIEREKINNFGGVPSMAWQVLESPDFPRRDTSTVTSIGYGGAPAAPDLVRRIKELFPEVTARNGYGLTETSAITTMNYSSDYERKPDSVGLPIPVCDVRVVDEGGQALPVGGVGELWIRGPNVVRDYWRRPRPVAATDADGWLHTGDVARIDEEGFVYILDRTKDIVIRGGENVYCVEVEDVLYGHPDVMDAAVVGIPHRILGEEVGAVVQTRPGARTDPEALRAHVAAQLAAFMVPVRIDLRSQPLPRNPNGKILKRNLKRELGWE